MSDPILQFRRRLLELGCPPAPLRRIVREFAEHHHDLQNAALASGLDPAAARARADSELGDPVALAEQHLAVLRQSSWWGRHPVLAFGLVPLLATPILWALWLGLGIGSVSLLLYGGNSVAFGHAVNNPYYFYRFALALRLFGHAGIALEAILFCWLARRFALGAKWMFTACAVVAFHAFGMWARVAPHNFSIGYGYILYFWKFPLSNFLSAAIPLLIAALSYAWQRRSSTRLDATPLPREIQ
ncbi:MAG: hypothetical protein ABSH19_04545 [Opitutales bacterium]|jgi:hypothetical protein